jgi:hypothetical protein
VTAAPSDPDCRDNSSATTTRPPEGRPRDPYFQLSRKERMIAKILLHRKSGNAIALIS